MDRDKQLRLYHAMIEDRQARKIRSNEPAWADFRPLSPSDQMALDALRREDPDNPYSSTRSRMRLNRPQDISEAKDMSRGLSDIELTESLERINQGFPQSESPEWLQQSLERNQGRDQAMDRFPQSDAEAEAKFQHLLDLLNKNR